MSVMNFNIQKVCSDTFSLEFYMHCICVTVDSKNVVCLELLNKFLYPRGPTKSYALLKVIEVSYTCNMHVLCNLKQNIQFIQ